MWDEASEVAMGVEPEQDVAPTIVGLQAHPGEEIAGKQVEEGRHSRHSSFPQGGGVTGEPTCVYSILRRKYEEQAVMALIAYVCASVRKIELIM